ncbi:TAXI family TRAP transporter solute-binding subunit [Haloferacaceae archaeon DSL9]
MATIAGCAADEPAGGGDDNGGGGNGDGGGDGGGGGGQSSYTLGTSAEGSSSFRIGSNFAQFLDTETDVDFSLDAIVTPGTGATYRMVDGQEVEFGGTTTQLLSDSPDQGSFEDEPLQRFDGIRQLRGYMSFFNFAVADTEAGIESWEDLNGEAVAISSQGSATRLPAEWVVDQEIGLDNIDPRYMAFADIPAALRGGQVSAAFTWATNGTIPQGWFQEIDATVEWAPLPLSDATLGALDSELEYSSYVEIDGAEISENYDGMIDGFSLTYLWVCLADVDPDVVYEIARISHENGEDLVEQDDVMGFFPDPDQFLGTIHPDVPVHQGAYEYYQDAGIWDEYTLTPPPEAE